LNFKKCIHNKKYYRIKKIKKKHFTNILVCVIVIIYLIREVETMAQYVDVKSGEKLPNGDVSQFMTAMNKELSSVKEKGTTEGLTLQDKAHFLAVARNLTGAIEYYTKLWSAKIANQEDKFEFKDLGLIVSSKAGGSTSEISSEIFDVLTVEEIKKVAKVTEKALKDNGKTDLIEKYKKITGTKANSVMYKSLI